ncbi:MAG: hypothetical protein ACXWYS_02755 [Gaiellaceae bacterium]
MSEHLVHSIQDAGFEFPPTPSLADAVVERLPAAPPSTRRRRVAPAVVALAACALLLALSDGARSAAADLFDLVPGISIEHGDPLPAASPLLVSERDFGRRVSLDEAARLAGFDLRLPRGLPPPAAVYLDRAAGVAAVTAVWGAGRYAAAVVLTQWHPARLMFRKLVLSPDTLVDAVEVDGTRGLWIRGQEHEVFYRGADGRSRRGAPVLVGNVLAWERGGIVYRMEANVDLDRAVRLASLHG